MDKFTFITQVIAMDPIDGIMKQWPGPEISAYSEEEAREKLDARGFFYAEILGFKVWEENRKQAGIFQKWIIDLDTIN